MTQIRIFTNARNSRERIDKFVDEFIRSEFVQNFQSERNSDFFNEPDRANRVYEAAESGGDGTTHAENINDWREAFDTWILDMVGWNRPERFAAAVHANFTACEAWHEANGSLHEVIG